MGGDLPSTRHICAPNEHRQPNNEGYLLYNIQPQNNIKLLKVAVYILAMVSGSDDVQLVWGVLFYNWRNPTVSAT